MSEMELGSAEEIAKAEASLNQARIGLRADYEMTADTRREAGVDVPSYEAWLEKEVLKLVAIKNHYQSELSQDQKLEKIRERSAATQQDYPLSRAVHDVEWLVRFVDFLKARIKVLETALLNSAEVSMIGENLVMDQLKRIQELEKEIESLKSK